MTELSKRIITSFFLILLFILSVKYFLILIILVLFCSYEIFYELYALFNKIFLKRSKKNLYLISIITLTYLTFLNFIILNIYTNNIYEKKILLLFIISVCVSSDIGGYVFGNIFKGKKLTKISPNKTYSGLFGSFIFSLIITLSFFDKTYNTDEIILYSLIISSVSQSGDLFISFLKRKAKIKDTGQIFPGHGGIMDRLDGLIFAIPFGFIIL